MLSEYLQVLESFSELSVTQEMNRGIEVSFLWYLIFVSFFVLH